MRRRRSLSIRGLSFLSVLVALSRLASATSSDLIRLVASKCFSSHLHDNHTPMIFTSRHRHAIAFRLTRWLVRPCCHLAGLVPLGFRLHPITRLNVLIHRERCLA